MIFLLDTLDIDPGLESFMNKNRSENWEAYKKADVIRLWAKHFAPMGSIEGVQILNSWNDFFIMSLLNPSRFDWAKSCLSSTARNLILKGKESEASVAFSIPNKCPENGKISCVSENPLERAEIQTKGGKGDMLSDSEACNTPEFHGAVEKILVSTSSLHVKRKRLKAPLVVFEARRSDRLKIKAMGFKTDAY
jgi:hypothetical protein